MSFTFIDISPKKPQPKALTNRELMKKYLDDTDYVIIKLYEAQIGIGGAIFEDIKKGYDPVIQKRLQYRVLLGGSDGLEASLSDPLGYPIP